MSEITSTEEGWVITNRLQDDIYEFTFARTRRDAIKNILRLWPSTKLWKSFYNAGHRCVNATRTIKVEG